MYNEATAPAKARYVNRSMVEFCDDVHRHLAGQMRLSTLAVHPGYWHRGHASRLVRWSTCLADLDGVPMVKILPLALGRSKFRVHCKAGNIGRPARCNYSSKGRF